MDEFIIGNKKFKSRFLLGTGKFSLDKMEEVIKNAETEIVTLALRRANSGGEGNILDLSLIPI